jgi:ribosomal protein S18 acetylase RimI-like enzyme
MQKAMEIAKELDVDVTANVMEDNTNSKKMFTRLGFTKIDGINGNGFYRYEQPGKERGSK